MQKPVITVDFDDIVAYFFKHFLPWCAETKGTSLLYKDMHDYGDHTLLHPDGEAVRIWFVEYVSGRQKQCQPVEGAIEQLLRLHAHFEIHLVTSRPESMRPALEMWCQHHGISDIISSAVFTNSFGNDPHAPKTDKPTVCHDLGAVAHIDDAINHAIAVTESGIPVFMLERPWNKGKIPARAVLAKDWPHISELILEMSQ